VRLLDQPTVPPGHKKGGPLLDRLEVKGPVAQFRVPRTIETLLLTERIEAIAATAISDTIMVSSTTDAPCWFLRTLRRNAIMSINLLNRWMLETILKEKREVNEIERRYEQIRSDH
jgi:hypothetical protein